MTLPDRRRLDAAAALRLLSDWRDPEITTTTLMTRFGLNRLDVNKFKRLLGERPKPGSSSVRAIRNRRYEAEAP